MNRQDKLAWGGLAMIVLGTCLGTAGLLRDKKSSPTIPQTTAPTPPPAPVQTRPYPRFDSFTRIGRDLDETWTYENKDDGMYLRTVNFTFKDVRDTLERAQNPLDSPRYAVRSQMLNLRHIGTRQEYIIIGNRGHYMGNGLDVKLEGTVDLELYESNPPYERLIKRFRFTPEIIQRRPRTY